MKQVNFTLKINLATDLNLVVIWCLEFKAKVIVVRKEARWPNG